MDNKDMSAEKTVCHELKTWCEYFEEVFMGRKTFELRKDDRGFEVGHFLILKEWDHVKGEYTGRSLARRIRYVLKGGQFGLQEGFVIMSIA